MSARAKKPLLEESATQDNIDIFLLQETLIPENRPFSLKGYNSFSLPHTRGGARGCMILIRNHIPATIIDPPLTVGNTIELLGVEITLENSSMKIYNVYRSATKELDLHEVTALAASDRIFIGGDFNAHHPMLGSTSPTNEAGRHIAEVLTDNPDITLLNDTTTPTHLHGGRLDLSLINTSLAPLTKWDLHPTLTSDHYAIICTIKTPKIPTPLPPPPRWNTKRADWINFTKTLEEQVGYEAPPNLEEHTHLLTNAFRTAAKATIPRTAPPKHHHKDYWFYCDRVKEINRRLNRAKKMYRARPTLERLRLLQSVINHSIAEKAAIKEEKWLEWCRSLNSHSTLSSMWKRLKAVSNPQPTKPPSHPNPQEEAEKMAENFASRTSLNQLPANILNKQNALHQERTNLIDRLKATPVDTDHPFTQHELEQATKTSTDTAPGSDEITYSMIAHAGQKAKTALLNLINHSWEKGKIPNTWKQAIIQPIPKPQDPKTFRPISLLSCAGKTAERMVLQRLQWQLPPPHKHSFAYTNGRGTAECISSFLTAHNNCAGLAVFIDLEKAFELACPEAILATLAGKGVGGRLLSWIEDFFHDRGAAVRFQGQISSHRNHENGTPQGSILSPTLFNRLIEELLNLHLGQHTTLLAYADDLTLFIHGKPYFDKAQRALNKLYRKCAELGLKINANKTKAMAIRTPQPRHQLLLGHTPVEYTTTHRYLGVIFDSKLTFKPEVAYLRTRANSRLNALKFLAGKGRGASQKVLKLFYIQAIRSLVDYAAPAILTLNHQELQKLEVIQNNAMRTITNSPMWTKLCNLRVETKLESLDTRIQSRIAVMATKSARNDAIRTTTHKIKTATELHPDLLTNSWAHSAAKAVKNLGVAEELRAPPDTPDPEYHSQPPWVSPAIKIIIPNTLPKKTTPPLLLRQEGLRRIAYLNTPSTTVYYTDGSITSTGAGAAFECEDRSGSQRLSSEASTLQTELVAINMALLDAKENAPDTKILIHTDSLSALHALKQPTTTDNTKLITNVHTIAQNIKETGGSVVLHWIPSHVNIAGNERVDKLAREATKRTTIDTSIPASKSKLKANIKTRAQKIIIEEHKLQVQGGSPSAQWYALATKYEPAPPTPDNITLKRLRRIRFGYKSLKQKIEGIEKETCEHCGQEAPYPLLHYVLKCPATKNLRGGRTLPNPDIPTTHDAAILPHSLRLAAAAVIAHVPDHKLIQTIQTNPPPF